MRDFFSFFLTQRYIHIMRRKANATLLAVYSVECFRQQSKQSERHDSTSVSFWLTQAKVTPGEC